MIFYEDTAAISKKIRVWCSPRCPVAIGGLQQEKANAAGIVVFLVLDSTSPSAHELFFFFGASQRRFLCTEVGERVPFVGIVGVPWVVGRTCMSQAKRRSVYQPQQRESSKRFKPGTSTEHEQSGAETAAGAVTHKGAMSLQCAEVRTSSSWQDD